MKFLPRSAFLLVSLLLFPLALFTEAQADEARVLTWADLVPSTAVTENPFLELSRDQLTWISDVAAVRALYDRFVEERYRTGEGAAPAYESFRELIGTQTAKILGAKGARAVDFRLEPRDGKVALKARVVK